MDLKDVITLCIAGYAAALSTYVAVVQRLDKRARVTSKIAYGYLTHGSNLSEAHLLITAANTGDKSVTIASGSVQLPDGTSAISFANNSTVQIPHDLGAGKSLTMWFEVKPLAIQLRARGFSGKIKVRSKFIDQTSREFLSKPILLDLEDWASS